MNEELSPETAELLRILAAVDVTFSPWPDPIGQNQCCSEIFHRQLSHLRGDGLPWSSGGSSDHRKHGERLLHSLQRAGLIALPRARGQHRRVQLTPRGDDLSRGLLGHATAADSWPLLLGMAEAVRQKHGVGPTNIWLLQSQLRQALDVDDDMVGRFLLPLLSRGYVVSSVDTVGDQYYTVQKAGMDAAAAPVPSPQDAVEEDERAGRVYWEAFHRLMDERPRWRPALDNETFVPFPARR